MLTNNTTLENWKKTLAMIYYGMVKLLPIMLGKVPGKRVKVTLVTHPT